MKLSNIRDILAVAECGSLRAASRTLGITQPSMSRSIRDTEHELGLQLFKRSSNGLAPTNLGLIFIRRATIIQNELRRINEELSQARGDFIGQISVAMSAAAGIALIPKVLESFGKRYPNALVKLTESLFKPVESDIISGSIDFFVGPYVLDVHKTSLRVDVLFNNRRIVVSRKGHPLANVKRFSSLSEARWVRPFLSDNRDDIDFEAYFENAGLPKPNIAIHTHSTMMTLLAVAHSDLLTILPMQWLDLSLAQQRLDILPIEDDLPAPTICVIRRGDVPLTPLAQAFYDMVEKVGANYQLKIDSQHRDV